MKNTLPFFLLFMLSVAQIWANENPAALLQQLMNVNAQWQKQPEAKNLLTSIEVKNIQTFNEWIAIHLMLVEHILRSRSVAHLSAHQRQNRLMLLDKLSEYRKAGVFPVNDYLPCKNPVFIDRVGTFCAVGYLMQQSGATTLARQIDACQKFAYIYEITVPGVKEWADENGFTLDELAWIQPGYPPAIDAEDMKKGLDGTVNVIVADKNSQIIYAAGSFSKAIGSGITCNNIAAWISGFAGYDWVPLGNGVNGTIHAMLLHDNKLYIGGEFTMADNMPAPHVAIYDLQLGQWMPMGSLDSTVRALAVYNNAIYAGGDFSGLVSKWNGNSWQTINNGLIGNGHVRALEIWNNQLVIGGDFDINTGATRKHVLRYDGNQLNIMGFGTPTPVNDLEVHQQRLYAACDFIDGTDTCALAFFDTDNDIWKVDLSGFISSGFSTLTGNSFRHLLSSGNQLIIAGDFVTEDGMTLGNNLMSYSEIIYPGDTNVYKILSPLLSVDRPVNCVEATDIYLYFGGEFITNAYSDTLNHIGYLQLTPVGIHNKTASAVVLKAFPNPVSDVVNFQTISGNKITGYEIFDTNGKMMYKENISMPSSTVSFQQLPRGTYYVKVNLPDESIILTLVKQ